jgi:hypothetical protein
MKIGDWVMARTDNREDEPDCEWKPARLEAIDRSGDGLPFAVNFIDPDPTFYPRWKAPHRVRLPTDKEWAQIAAHILIEGE